MAPTDSRDVIAEYRVGAFVHPASARAVLPPVRHTPWRSCRPRAVSEAKAIANVMFDFRARRGSADLRMGRFSGGSGCWRCSNGVVLEGDLGSSGVVGVDPVTRVSWPLVRGTAKGERLCHC
jgi:hypothetical protein